MADLTSSEGLWVHARSFDVTIWPEGLISRPESAMDADTWKVTVEYRGNDLFAVCMPVRKCLGRDGTWDYEVRPSEREDDWLAAHRFPLDEALDLARQWAPRIKLNGMTAAEVLARHQPGSTR
jgi:hypothetical protein